MGGHSEDSLRRVTPAMLEGFPEPVQRYMAFTGVAGYPWIDTRAGYRWRNRVFPDGQGLVVPPQFLRAVCLRADPEKKPG